MEWEDDKEVGNKLFEPLNVRIQRDDSAVKVWREDRGGKGGRKMPGGELGVVGTVWRDFSTFPKKEVAREKNKQQDSVRNPRNSAEWISAPATRQDNVFINVGFPTSMFWFLHKKEHRPSFSSQYMSQS